MFYIIIMHIYVKQCTLIFIMVFCHHLRIKTSRDLYFTMYYNFTYLYINAQKYMLIKLWHDNVINFRFFKYTSTEGGAYA